MGKLAKVSVTNIAILVESVQRTAAVSERPAAAAGFLPELALRSSESDRSIYATPQSHANIPSKHSRRSTHTHTHTPPVIGEVHITTV